MEQNQEKTLVKQTQDLANLSNKELIAAYNPKICLQNAAKYKTVSLAMYSDMPTIARMHREKSREFTEALIMSWLVYLNSMLNLKKSMHEEQIVLCSSEIVNEFYMLNFADLTILIKRIITGEYGKFYESISIADVLTFFRSYLEERFDLAEQDSIQKHNNIASDQTFNHSKNVRRNWEKGKYKTY